MVTGGYAVRGNDLDSTELLRPDSGWQEITCQAGQAKKRNQGDDCEQQSPPVW